MKFRSPSKGEMTLEEVFNDILKFMGGKPDHKFNLIIGTDSQTTNSGTCFVTAIIVHQVGKGAIYYYRKKSQRKITSLRQKIFFETSLSLETAGKITGRLAEKGHEELNVEIHIDIGTKGETKELIREVVGMVVGSGYNAKIKPDSCGASKVADKYTK
ncbi:MAG: uncharacterized protein PWQ96_1488 [Clostridia bacterium]|nr:uncharacterized protein [Clostridia bacterium]